MTEAELNCMRHARDLRDETDTATADRLVERGWLTQTRAAAYCTRYAMTTKGANALRDLSTATPAKVPGLRKML